MSSTVNPNAWFCPMCRKVFKREQYFKQHHSYTRYRQCYEYFEANPSTTPAGPYATNRGADQGTTLPQIHANDDQLAVHEEAPEVVDTGFDDSGWHEDDVAMEDAFMQEVNTSMESPTLDDDSEDAPQNVADAGYNPDADLYTEILENFTRYQYSGDSTFAPLQPEYRAAIELMSILDKAGAPLTVYDKIMNWHVKHSVCEHCKVETQLKVTDKDLINKLKDRYNMADLRPYNIRVYLPHSEIHLDIPCHDGGAMLRDLLSDPGIRDADYLFFNDDPTQGPPPHHEWTEVSDINTGLCYRETYRIMIQPNPFTRCGRKRVLVPFIFYLDACVTGQFQNLSLEILKFTLGIFKSQSRDKGSFWRNLGAIPSYQRAKKRSLQSIARSANKDAKSYLTDSEPEDDAPDEGESAQQSTNISPDFDYLPYIDYDNYDGYDDDFNAVMDDVLNPEIPNTNAQDFHCILHTILASYKRIQDSGGVPWDLWYKGKKWLLCLIPFIIFIKGDGVEHDKHCGKYGSRTKGVKQLCRKCCCPTDKTDDPYVDHDMKTKEMLTELIRKKNHVRLKELSQKYVWNAWYELRFGLHNEESVHGATCMEMIHWIQLGQFKYSREMLFKQTGEGELGQQINVCATSMGPLLQRQSDKNFPRTKFTSGVMKGKLMAHEYTGVILVLAATLRCARGRKVIDDYATTNKQKENFTGSKVVSDWVYLLEHQLMFLAWLKLPSVKVHDVIQLEFKIRCYMNTVKLVGNRTEGMGFKTMNFHGTMHVPKDILNFGVPRNVDTMSDEMHHKDDKQSSKRTQARPATFDMQSLRQIENRRVIEMGMMEVADAGKVRWRYNRGFLSNEAMTQGIFTPNAATIDANLSGVTACFWIDAASDRLKVSLSTQMKGKHRYQYPAPILEEIYVLLFDLEGYMDTVNVHSEYITETGQIYRASPRYKGKPWYDWAMFGNFPNHIKAFVDLTELPVVNDTTGKYKPGYYALVETTSVNVKEEELALHSDIFVPFVKVPHKDRPEELNLEWKRVEEITGPACLFPDLANEHKSAFLRVKPMSAWADMFIEYIHEDSQV